MLPSNIDAFPKELLKLKKYSEYAFVRVINLTNFNVCLLRSITKASWLMLTGIVILL